MQVAMPVRSRGAEKLKFRNGSVELYDVEDPGPNDVLFGRGTGSNMHTGNIRFRALIQKYKPIYRDTPKKMKPSVSTKVVNIWRAQNPPGRFLTRSDRFHGSKRTFYDVGDAMARRKAAQCLREKSSKERNGSEQQPTSEEDEAIVAMALSSTAAGRRAVVADDQKEAQEESLAADLFSAPSSSSTNTSNEFLNFHQNATTVTTATGKDYNMKDTHSLNSLMKPRGLPCSESNTLEFPTTSLKKTVASSKYNDNNKTNNHNSDHLLSLMEVYAAESTDTFGLLQKGDDESPFLFASFDLGGGNAEDASNNNAGEDNQDESGGLCFPSLMGDSTPGSAPLFENDADDDSPLFPSLPSLAALPGIPIIMEEETHPNSLQIIRDSMPTAASLITTNLFDF